VVIPIYALRHEILLSVCIMMSSSIACTHESQLMLEQGS
jgi:hypothetical protein